MSDQLRDGRIIGDDHALKSPLFAEHILHQPAVSRGRDAVHRVEGGHDHLTARFHPGLIGGQIVLPQPALRHIHRIVISAALRRSVGRKMLHTGSDPLSCAFLRKPFLKALHAGFHIFRVHVRIFSGGLQTASPARVTHQIPHGRKGDLCSARHALLRGRRAQTVQQFRLKGASQRQRNGIDRAEAVNDVRHEQ